MRILFLEISSQLFPENCSDYQLDMLFHGLIKSGHEVYSFHDHWWMYESEKQKRPEDFNKIWGRGFTIYGTIKHEEKTLIHHVGLSDLSDYSYDVVVIGLHHTVISEHNTILGVINFVSEKLGIPTQKIAVIDGWDRPELNREIASKTLYFKRELYPEYEDCALPISFAFPEEKICYANLDYNIIHSRKYDIAPLIPVNQSIDPSYMSTYKYDTEEEYYRMYQDSYFGLTSKKGGWDTLRHYEIIANGCIPLFVDIEKCPPKTLHLFPKDLCIFVKDMEWVQLNYKDGISGYPKILDNCACINIENPGTIDKYITPAFIVDRHERIIETIEDFQKWLTNYGTTKYLAEYVLEHVKNR